MNRDETVALFLQGREAWNAWAERMLAERKALEEAGKWQTENLLGLVIPRSNESRRWIENALADFSNCSFHTAGTVANPTGFKPEHIFLDTESADLSGFMFPGDVEFERATFNGTVDFGGTNFNGDASFSSAAFRGRADFEHATLAGRADFRGTKFISIATFRSATYVGDADFEGAIFNADADFRSATFRAVFDQYGSYPHDMK
jgi:uncharacterized protein YjbI with pentapeptide repeats